MGQVQNKIYFIRGHKVMLDSDLAGLYGVENRHLKQQVRRNLKRFPEDFMFELTWEEAQYSRSQIVTLKKGQNIKYLPYAFTEQGVAMLSSVLNSNRAIDVNIQIMRVFTRLRELIISNKDLAKKIEELERKFMVHDKDFKMVFAAIRELMMQPNKDVYKKTKSSVDLVIAFLKRFIRVASDERYRNNAIERLSVLEACPKTSHLKPNYVLLIIYVMSSTYIGNSSV